MIIKAVGQDPSMNNWGLVAAEIDLSNDCAVKITDMLVARNVRKDMKANKSVRRSYVDLERARDLSADVHAFINKHKPNFTMVEVPHGSQSASAMKGYGICLGVLGSIKTPMIQLNETECKIHTLGRKSGTKAEAIEWAMNRFPDAPWKMRKSKGQLVSVDGYNEHLADACAALETGMYTDQFINAVELLVQMTRAQVG